MQITVLNNQSLIDIATQTTGIPENFLNIAIANNLVPTAVIEPGAVLTIPEEIEKDDQIVNYYQTNSIKIATAVQEELLTEPELTCEEKLYECFK
jgi:hypothetical protein